MRNACNERYAYNTLSECKIMRRIIPKNTFIRYSSETELLEML